ncbi:NAD-dependent epimerase/dehydratase family protein [Cupriavidus necator]|uniref:NAD-dependent epimerase/dehydratase family protein n=1 Tax=Cupriavidus necator TaxID=106590 RepID=UPI0005B4FD7A|nr:NAD-dependent epimerase/dehydratase family protein [Cupriavidus necator]
MINIKTALIGHSGYVGSTLMRQTHFDDLYRSSNIGAIGGKRYRLLVCAGAPAQKWIANRDPMQDRQKVESLITQLRTVQCEQFVLVSTVDVFKTPRNVDEATPIDEEELHPYGLHRRLLERFIEEKFPRHLIVRLPGLVGPGLRKNVIFDLLNNNNVQAIDSRGVFQFYPMVNLWADIQTAISAGLSLVHLTAEPVSVFDVASQGFGKHFEHALTGAVSNYDFRTKYASLFGGHGYYQYSRRETLQAIRAYAQSEPLQSE